MAFKKKNNGLIEPKINDEIKYNSDVRVVYEEDGNKKCDVMSLDNAKLLSNKLNLDLIEINPNSNPPVLKIGNYSKYLYELKKQAKEKSKNHTELKEIQITTNISMHDLEIKANKAKEFINKGDKVKVVLTMQGRELSRRNESEKRLLEFMLLLEDVASYESMPKSVGTKSIVILKRKK